MDRLNIMTMQQTMDYLNVSRATIDRWRKDKQLPFIKIGKEVLFEKTAIDEWIRGYSTQESHDETTVIIGYQSRTAHMWTALLIKELGYFKEELEHFFPMKGFSIHWHNAASGLELVELMIKGKVHIASLGDYPMTICNQLSKLFPEFQSVILAFDGKTEKGCGISFVAPKQATIISEQLFHNPISTVTNSSADVRLLELVSAFGQDIRPKVVHQYMDDSLDSIAQQRIGGSVMWEPYPSLLRHYDKGQIIIEEVGESDYLTGIVSENSWLQHNEAVTISYLKAHIRIHQLLRNNPYKAAQILASCTNLPLQIILQVIIKVRWDSTIYGRDIDTLKRFHSQRTNDKSDDHSFLVKTEYLQMAIDELNLPLLTNSIVNGHWSTDVLY
ncbi:hypothetical protein WQ54_21325 [Bacillus sp. SA1-12]|nr:hypothetical protein WQ54_21325 [Bacillus sp. SA1-12]